MLRKFVFLGRLVGVIFVIVWSAALVFGDVIQPWVELFNGATWPTDALKQYCDHPIWFSLFVALRTVLNVGPVFLIALLAWDIIVTLRAGKERVMNLLELLKLRDLEATNRVMRDLEINLEHKKKVERAIAAAADAWERVHLPGILGKEAAEKLFQQRMDAQR